MKSGTHRYLVCHCFCFAIVGSVVQWLDELYVCGSLELFLCLLVDAAGGIVCCICVVTFEYVCTVFMLCRIVLFKLLSCLSCFVSVDFVFVGAILREIGHGLGLYCFLLCTSVVV